MLSTVVNQTGTGYPFRMEVVFDIERDSYFLVFSSMSYTSSGHEETKCTSFADALYHYNCNCKFYNKEGESCTEEEFLGVPIGTLYPTSATTKKEAI